jgi:hypothetical protein
LIDLLLGGINVDVTQHEEGEGDPEDDLRALRQEDVHNPAQDQGPGITEAEGKVFLQS